MQPNFDADQERTIPEAIQSGKVDLGTFLADWVTTSFQDSDLNAISSLKKPQGIAISTLDHEQDIVREGVNIGDFDREAISANRINNAYPNHPLLPDPHCDSASLKFPRGTIPNDSVNNDTVMAGLGVPSLNNAYADPSPYPSPGLSLFQQILVQGEPNAVDNNWDTIAAAGEPSVDASEPYPRPLSHETYGLAIPMLQNGTTSELLGACPPNIVKPGYPAMFEVSAEDYYPDSHHASDHSPNEYVKETEHTSPASSRNIDTLQPRQRPRPYTLGENTKIVGMLHQILKRRQEQFQLGFHQNPGQMFRVSLSDHRQASSVSMTEEDAATFCFGPLDGLEWYETHDPYLPRGLSVTHNAKCYRENCNDPATCMTRTLALEDRLLVPHACCWQHNKAEGMLPILTCPLGTEEHATKYQKKHELTLAAFCPGMVTRVDTASTGPFITCSFVQHSSSARSFIRTQSQRKARGAADVNTPALGPSKSPARKDRIRPSKVTKKLAPKPRKTAIMLAKDSKCQASSI